VFARRSLRFLEQSADPLHCFYNSSLQSDGQLESYHSSPASAKIQPDRSSMPYMHSCISPQPSPHLTPQKSTSSLTFKRSPPTIASLFSSNSNISHVTFTYLPPNHSRFCAVSQTIVSAGNSTDSVKTNRSSSGISPEVAFSVIILPGWIVIAVTP
jgi:hypothetical protein